MKVWLIHPGELLPIDVDARLFRYSYLADALTEAGHEVVRFAPTFAHSLKRFRAEQNESVRMSPHYEIQLLHAGSYSHNRSPARFIFNLRLARAFAENAAQREPPEIIVCGVPLIELCARSVELGRQWGIPVLLDVRDLWPDIYLGLVPKPARTIARLAMAPMFNQAARVLAGADGILAVSQSYLDWARNLAGRRPLDSDRVLLLGAKPLSKTKPDTAWLTERGVDASKLKVCFVGQFELSYDIQTIVDAAQLAEQRKLPIQFVMAGKGTGTASVEATAQACDSMAYVGWLDREKLEDLILFSDIGLSAYSSEALQSLPNKPFEYMSGGLALLNSLPGEAATLIQTHELGLNYAAGDTEDLLAKLTMMATDRDRLAKWQQNSRTLFDQEFNVNDTARTFVCHLEQVVASHSTTR